MICYIYQDHEPNRKEMNLPFSDTDIQISPNYLLCGGVKVSGIKTRSAKKRKSPQPTLQTIEFIPYFDEKVLIILQILPSKFFFWSDPCRWLSYILAICKGGVSSRRFTWRAMVPFLIFLVLKAQNCVSFINMYSIKSSNFYKKTSVFCRCWNINFHFTQNLLRRLKNFGSTPNF